MNTIKQNLQKILSDDVLFRQVCEENPWGFLLESSRVLYKVMPQAQWNQVFYKNHWSFSIMDKKNG